MGIRESLKIPALVGCQNQTCAENVSYRFDMVRIWKGAPICEECYLEMSYDEDSETKIEDWNDLPQLELTDLIE